MPGAKLTRLQLADQVVERLRGLIADGALRQGDRLPSETELSRELGVGRSTVREALRVLAHLGLIETRKGSGSYVSGTPGPVSPGPSSAVAAADLADLFEFRFALESEIAQLAAQRRTPGQLRRILQALENVHEAVAKGASATSVADVELHLAIAEAGNNRYLREVYESYQATFAAAADRLIGMQAPSHIRDVHDDLVEAIAVQDVRAAAAAVRRTFDEIRVRLRLLA
ncbi:DNA-binding FadR family transcriptional regulator [Thermocatellispora tengchongensis]|uniref:DNA-binding FadR family transcriptional regulator n=1 Tax=Thermocatellispora tengchongensis TaxID=1073253 RepID=A0A840PMB7_9ACTN|nr:GntR family transcriptional regulator [Thermocatellispora tengchongensis]MBB5140212.1 DNA-binding FadR family transcriptional regulator [Thermocatellispora tengchongensis]